MPTNAERMAELEQQLAQLDSQQLERLEQLESHLAQLDTNQAETRALVIRVEGEITELRAEHSASEERIREQVCAVQVQQEASVNRFGSPQEELNGKADAVTQKLDSMSNDLASVLGRFSDSDRRMQQRVIGVTPRNNTVDNGGATSTDPAIPFETSRSAALNSFSVSDKMKIWKRGISFNAVESQGDPKFVAVKEDFKRLHQRFGLPDELEKEMIKLAFKKGALSIANEVCRDKDSLSALLLWDVLEDRLYNGDRRRAQNASFLKQSFNETTESVQAYAEKIHLLGSSFQIDSDLITARFIEGLPRYLQEHAYGVNGTFDEIVSAVRNIAVSKGVRERVKVVEESGVAPDGLKSKCLCYRSGKPGHFARDTSKCEQHPKHGSEKAAASNSGAGERGKNSDHSSPGNDTGGTRHS